MWFVFALLSVVLTGFQSFGQKIAVQRGYDTVLQSALTALVATLLSLVLYAFTPSAHTHLSGMFFALGIVGGVAYLLSSIARLESLKFIDSTIHFPLYKVVGPAIVAGIGIGLLGDMVSPSEFVGIILSCLVPMLLITRSEHHRQKNLKLGVFFTLIATVLAAVTAGANAYLLKGDPYLVLPIVVITCFFGFVFGLCMFLRRHKVREMRSALLSHLSLPFAGLASSVGIALALSSYTYLLAVAGSDVSLVYSINAHYILIPVLLSVWFYKEHWNKQKALALVLSVLALILLHR